MLQIYLFQVLSEIEMQEGCREIFEEFEYTLFGPCYVSVSYMLSWISFLQGKRYYKLKHEYVGICGLA